MDWLDQLDVDVKTTNLRAEKLAKTLRHKGITVESVEPATQDVDADVRLGNGFAVQVSVDGSNMLTHWDGERATMFPPVITKRFLALGILP